MNFRENLKAELAFKGLEVKELAEKTGIAKGTIDHYLAEKSTSPSVENAVKIAKVLKTTVEFLVTGQDAKISKESSENIEKLLEYSQTIQALSQIPQKTRENIKKMILELSNSFFIYEEIMKKNEKL